MNRWLVIPLLLAPAMQPARNSRSFSYRTDIGIAVRNANETCLSIPGKLQAGAVVRLIDATEPQAASTARTGAPVNQCGNPGPGERHYQLLGVRPPLRPSAPVIAIAGFSGPLIRRGRIITADLDHDGIPEYFRACTSAEGVHFTIWSGAPLAGRRRFHRYYYLGYDTEPNCTTAETEEEQ